VLGRPSLTALSRATQCHLLAQWLRLQNGPGLAAPQLEDLQQRLQPGGGPGSLDLPRGWRLCWDRMEIRLQPPLAEQRPATSPDQPEN
jgi:hypothetical protein